MHFSVLYDYGWDTGNEPFLLQATADTSCLMNRERSLRGIYREMTQGCRCEGDESARFSWHSRPRRRVLLGDRLQHDPVPVPAVPEEARLLRIVPQLLAQLPNIGADRGFAAGNVGTRRP